MHTRQVREDVETAAALHALAAGVPLMPDPSSYSDTEGIAAAIAALPPAPAVDAATFSDLMDGALSKRRKPRAYLVPSPTSKQAAPARHQPSINQKSRELASRLRPSEVPLHDLLHQTGEMTRQRLESARRAAEEAELSECTFAPRLSSVTNGVAVEGRALRAASSLIAAGSIAAQQNRAAAAAAAGVPLSGRSSAAVGTFAASSGPSTTRLRPAAVPQQQQQQQYAQHVAAVSELEAELQTALNGVQLAEARLGALESGATPRSGGGGVSQEEMRATEAMLLNMLSASSPQAPGGGDEAGGGGGAGVDPEDGAAVIDELHRRLVEAPQQAQQQPARASQQQRAAGALSGRTSRPDAVARKAAAAVSNSATLQQLEGIAAGHA